MRILLAFLLITVSCVLGNNNVRKASAVATLVSAIASAGVYTSYLEAKQAFEKAPWGDDRTILKNKFEARRKALVRLIGFTLLSAGLTGIQYIDLGKKEERIAVLEEQPAVKDSPRKKLEVPSEWDSQLDVMLQLKKMGYDLQNASGRSFETRNLFENIKKVSKDGHLLNPEFFQGKSLFLLLLQNNNVSLNVIKSCCALLKQISDKELFEAAKRDPSGSIIKEIFAAELKIPREQKETLLVNLLKTGDKKYKKLIKSFLLESDSAVYSSKFVLDIQNIIHRASSSNCFVPMLTKWHEKRFTKMNLAARQIQTLFHGKGKDLKISIAMKKLWDDSDMSDEQCVINIKTCIEHGANINQTNAQGNTLLCLMAMNGKSKALAELIAAGADMKIGNPLHKAAAAGSVTGVRALAEQGLSISELDSEGQTPLTCAAVTGRVDVIKALIALDAKSLSTDYPLHKAAAAGNLHGVTALVAEGFDINEQDKSELTPLCYAAQHNKCDIINLLIDDRANTAISRPLHIASQFGSTQAVSALLDRGMSVDVMRYVIIGAGPASRQRYCTPLYVAVCSNKLDTAQVLVTRGAQIIQPGSDSPLHAAAEYGSDEMMRFLVEKVEINILGSRPYFFSFKNSAGNTPVDIIISKCNWPFLMHFVEKGWQINISLLNKILDASNSSALENKLSAEQFKQLCAKLNVTGTTRESVAPDFALKVALSGPKNLEQLIQADSSGKVYFEIWCKSNILNTIIDKQSSLECCYILLKNGAQITNPALLSKLRSQISQSQDFVYRQELEGLLAKH